jgi:hypothetical protein
VAHAFVKTTQITDPQKDTKGERRFMRLMSKVSYLYPNKEEDIKSSNSMPYEGFNTPY